MTEIASVISNKARLQYQGTCYAHALATVIRAAQEGEGEFTETEHEKIVKQAIQIFGEKGAVIKDVLESLCPIYGMSWKKIDEKECESTIHNNQGIMAVFYLNEQQWKYFQTFFKKSPKGVMQKEDFKIFEIPNAQEEGHAVVISGRGNHYWKFKNSWGPEFAQDGHFRISKDALPFDYYKVYYLPKYLMGGYKPSHAGLPNINAKREAVTDEEVKELDNVIKKMKVALDATNPLAPITQENRNRPPEIQHLKPVFENNLKRMAELFSTFQDMDGPYSGKDPFPYDHPRLVFAKNPIPKNGIQQFTMKVEKIAYFAVGIASGIYHQDSLNKSELRLKRENASRNCYIITNLSEIFADKKHGFAVNNENPDRKPKKINNGIPITVTINFQERQVDFCVPGITNTRVPINSDNSLHGNWYPVLLVFKKWDYIAEFIY